PMNKTLIAMAAAALAVALAPAAQAGFGMPSVNAKPLVLKAGWHAEDYAEYLEEKAEEGAEALEDGEGYAPQRRAPAQRAAADRDPPPSAKNTADTPAKKDTKAAEAKPEGTDAKPEPKKADEPKKPDAKSVASADGTCKKYFSSVGMTLSVPCEQ